MKCARCKLKINKKEEKYVRITDFDSGRKGKEIFLHLKCWKEMYSEGMQKALREKVNQVMKIITQVNQ